LTRKWPIAHGKYQAMRLSDDDDCRAMLELCARDEHTIESYVEKDIVIHRESEGNSHVCSI